MIPTVSVIIPSYQHAGTIRACIESLLCQTELPKEIIVVDDGSTDNTHEIVKTFGERVMYLYQPNQGAPVARNAGTHMATGEFLLFCDADIIATPQMIERLHRALNAHTEASYAYSSFRWALKRFRAKSFNPSLLRDRNFIHTTSLIRTADFPGFDPTLKRFQDWDLWLTLLEQGKQGVAVKEELFRVQFTPRRKGISRWLPTFVYKIPWKNIGWAPEVVRFYQEAYDVIARKHHL